jgi:hypothetical protein
MRGLEGSGSGGRRRRKRRALGKKVWGWYKRKNEGQNLLRKLVRMERRYGVVGE